ncbi:MAG: alpha-amylase family glycosyl hydrolase [Chloroflexota bacterium]|nr:alpha-amylase family glycosyl hydrolase [Chloroflexota bacterium]
MKHWAFDSIFYHIYPLGFCGAPGNNDFSSAPHPRLDKLHGWFDHLEELGVNALYLGPLFESSRHGYDTVDYFQVDRRLGDNGTLVRLSQAAHARGIRLILDGVFHHVGRDFWAFRDVRHHREASRYRDWFAGLSFGGRSPFDDPFTYEGWNGHYELVKLNLHNPQVKAHLFEAVAMWIREFDIDGLRLDVADQLPKPFLRELAAYCRSLRADFWFLEPPVRRGWPLPRDAPLRLCRQSRRQPRRQHPAQPGPPLPALLPPLYHARRAQPLLWQRVGPSRQAQPLK